MKSQIRKLLYEPFISQIGQIFVSNTRPVQLMIIGIGNDLCDIRRIEKTLDRFGERFVQLVRHPAADVVCREPGAASRRRQRLGRGRAGAFPLWPAAIGAALLPGLGTGPHNPAGPRILARHTRPQWQPPRYVFIDAAPAND